MEIISHSLIWLFSHSYIIFKVLNFDIVSILQIQFVIVLHFFGCIFRFFFKFSVNLIDVEMIWFCMFLNAIITVKLGCLKYSCNWWKLNISKNLPITLRSRCWYTTKHWQYRPKECVNSQRETKYNSQGR